ncbi:MAG: YihY family inner membrane protein, partial [Gammaproteobacteria bacterium]|nr:YihY family inner membrane protein [Gammaproteobacteria bacterium]
FVEDDCSSVAKALTYQTLFALVPTIALAYMVLTAFDAFQGILQEFESFVFSNIVPESVGVVQSYLAQFSEQAKQLSIPSALMLGASAIWMLFTVEQSFNAIWQVKESRQGLQRFLTHWAILTLAPLLIAATLGVTTYILSLPLISDVSDSPITLWALPVIFNCGMLTTAFCLIPNTKVAIRNAFIGGLAASILAEGAKWGFSALIMAAPFQVIYGAFATLPILLLWIYLSWAIVLVGAELTRTLADGVIPRSRGTSPLFRYLGTLLIVDECFDQGLGREGIRSALAERYELSPEQITSDIAHLKSAGFVIEDANRGVVLAKSLEQITLHSLMTSLNVPRPTDTLLSDPGIKDEWVMDLCAQWKQSLVDEMALVNQPLKKIFSPSEASGA